MGCVDEVEHKSRQNDSTWTRKQERATKQPELTGRYGIGGRTGYGNGIGGCIGGTGIDGIRRIA